MSAARPLTYADVVRGITNEKQVDASCISKPSETKPFWLPSMSSDGEYTIPSMDDCVTELRTVSPESLLSQSEFRPLSPDSPVPQFRCLHINNSVELPVYRSFTPESTLSDWEGTDLCLETLFDETRPESPHSILSDFELEKLFSSRALSPESLSSDFDFSLVQDWLTDFRASSPESVTSVEQRFVCPQTTFGQMKSQRCNYYLEYSGSRPVSPFSIHSDVDCSGFCLEKLLDDNRPDSPDSLSSRVEANQISSTVTASPPMSAARPLTYADVVRGITNEKQVDASCISKPSETKPFWLPSMSSDGEYTIPSMDDCVTELRTVSPESLLSQSEFRPLSPDSPVPQFRCLHINNSVELPVYRSFTPESTLSDWEGTDLCLETLFDETRPESPHSILSDFELEKLFSSRALSPESLSSDFDFSLVQDWLTDFRASSPESVTSVEQRFVCPQTTFGQMKSQRCNYYLEYSGSRPVSPFSIHSDVDCSGFCLEKLLDDNRPDSPDSLSSRVEANQISSTVTASPPMSAARPLTYADVVRGITNEKQVDASCISKPSETKPFWLPSMSSDGEYTIPSMDDCVTELRTVSPESLLSQSEFRPLSPDSPVPQFRCLHINNSVELPVYRSFTPESTLSDWEGTDLCLETLFDETRPESPHSILSDFELEKLFSSRALSPESLSSDFDFSLVQDWLTDFRASSPESVTSVEQRFVCPQTTFGQMKSQRCNYYLEYSGSRPVSPFSIHSDVDCSGFCLEKLLDDNRPDSPDSLSSRVEANQISSTVTASPPMSAARPLTYADVVRGITNEKQVDASCISKPSETKPFWLPSMSSDGEYTIPSMDDCVTELRTVSPESLLSQSEFRPLSPDSPVPQFRCLHINNSVELPVYRSFTPESTLSDWEGTDLCLETLFNETRPESPHSILSDFELEKLFSSRALSPESLSSDFDFSLVQDWLTDFRASSPESVTSVEQRFVCPQTTFGQMKSQRCNYYLEYSGSRPVSPFSIHSDVDCSGFCLEKLLDDNRPDSPDSLSSRVEANQISSTVTASPPMSAARPLTYADVVRGITNEKQVDASCISKPSETKPFWLPSMSSDGEYTIPSMDDCVTELRTVSPESLLSQSEFRPLSPDSPVPQFRCLHINNSVELPVYRSFTPESTLSDWEGTDLCLETLFDETRPESPHSILSDFELEKLFSSRALSPESLSSDFDFSLVQDWLTDFRASSPESVTSVEQRFVCPQTTFGQMKSQRCNYYLEYSGSRPVSPFSIHSDVDCSGICFEKLLDDNRPDSPDSLSSRVDANQTSSIVTASPPMSAARPLTYADVVRGMTHKKQIDASSISKPSETKPFWLPSMSSDGEYTIPSVDDCVTELRTVSPESLLSQSEFRPLSPDSPVPQFRCLHINNSVELPVYRSFTPESTLSDWEGTDLCLETLFDETRPESPHSILSDFELEKLFNSRALSPESLSSDFDFSLVQDWLTDFRASSPESVTSVEQRFVSPQTTFGQMKSQRCNYYLEYSGSRPVSPFSIHSDVDCSGFCLEKLLDDNRPDSPDSLSSRVEANQISSTVTASPPMSAARPLTYADVVRGITNEKQVDASCISKPSETKLFWLPSMSSDGEYTIPSMDDCVTELRTVSPESLLSQSEFRPLSPDSPVPQFRCLHINNSVELPVYRSFTPESTLSDWEGTDLCLETLFDETRPESPHSVYSDFELYTLLSSRALSPESLSSDFDFSLLQDWLTDFRASSPESVTSVEQRFLSPQTTFGQMKSQHCNYYLEYSGSRPVSPLLIHSDVDCSGFCPKELLYGNRPDSLSSRVEAKPCEEQVSSLNYFLPETKLFSIENSCSVHEVQITISQMNLVPSESISSDSTHSSSAPRVRQKPILNNLMSHLYDPFYNGKCSCCERRAF
ncbi:uncharacterized protein LOC127140268 [Lates calcarifer]|uniref:Uncharacterized protein LOC127140268 n=1 Tax=Lates calcarifer TaxID=8187 RepID=A0AAJ8DM94_LATCA|nr:uncharacterized protein LOC127140268 [Lates calcarifer]